MTLDQTLTEIEPILRSSDGSFQFTHPSFQEVLTARQFADEIISGKLSLIDTYWLFWREEPASQYYEEPNDNFPNGTWPIDIRWFNIVNHVADIFRKKNYSTILELNTGGITDEYEGKYVNAYGLVSFSFPQDVHEKS